jgi:hypothetical protein
VRGGAKRSVLVGALAAVALTGCAGTRIQDGVFRSEKGYRVTVPEGWIVTGDGQADLTLKHRDGRHAILVNASCGPERQRGPLAVLARHLLSGLRERSVVTREDVSVNGKVARHTVVDARVGDTGEPVRLELYVMRDERCLYDFLYVAPPEAFDAERPAFERLVREFRTGD